MFFLSFQKNSETTAVSEYKSQSSAMTLVTIPFPKSLPSTPMQGTPSAMPPNNPRQASGAGGPIRSDSEAEANRTNAPHQIIGSRHGYGPGLFDIPTAALSAGSFVAPASPSCSPFKYWQPPSQPLETQQQSQSAQAKGGMHL